jgi:hypothetical protein
MKANSAKQQQTVFFAISLERKDKFIDTIRSTQKAGMLFRTLLNNLNCYS